MTDPRSTWTQDDVNDGPFTEFNEGFVSYLFGQFCHENPYFSCGDVELDDPNYHLWYDGWMSARERYPELEPFDG